MKLWTSATVLAAGLCLAAAPACHGQAAEPSFDPSQVGWNRLTFEASKLFIKMETAVDLTRTPTAEADLISPPKASLNGQKPILAELVDHQLAVETKVLGRRSREVVSYRAADGQAVQRSKRRFGSKSYSKIHRFLDSGILLRRTSPAEGESVDDVDSWTQRSDKLFSMPDAANCPAVVDPVQIFYLLSAAPLEKPGDSFELCVFSDKTFARLKAEVTALTERETTYALNGSPAQRRKVPVRAIALTTEPLGHQSLEEAVELIGLEGNLEIFLDEKNFPIEICGDHSKMGSVSIRLKAADSTRSAG